MERMNTWRRSTFCGGTFCVEVRHADGLVYIRDSAGGRELVFDPEEWAAFVAGVLDGQFDEDT